MVDGSSEIVNHADEGTAVSSVVPSRLPRCVWPECAEWAFRDLPICRDHALHAYWCMQPDRPVKPAALRGPSQTHKQHGTLYYLRVGERIKVGWTSNLPQRLAAYPPDTVVLETEPGTRQDETAMHRRCTPFRVAGREWYEPGPGMDRVIEEARERNALRAKLYAAQEPRHRHGLPRRPGAPDRLPTFTEGPLAREVKPAAKVVRIGWPPAKTPGVARKVARHPWTDEPLPPPRQR